MMTRTSATRLPVFLSLAGYETVLAGNGRDALALLRQRDFDLVVTDLKMPLLDGWQLIEAIRRDPRLAHLPICVVSAEPDGPVPSMARVRKPFDLRTLIRVVARLLAHSGSYVNVA
jgi:CheY-like chemotaxis protein